MSRALIGRLGRYFSGVTLASILVACATANDTSVHGDSDGSAGALASAGSAGSSAGATSAAGEGASADSAGAASTVSGAPSVSEGGAAGSAARAGASAGGAAGSAGATNSAGGAAAGSAGAMNSAGASAGGAAGTGGVSGTAGMAGHAGMAGSGGSGGSNTTPTLLSQGKTASADSEQAGNLASLGNDGVTTTRWCAADNGLNHNWQVDLGALKTLTKVDLTWEKSVNYKFLIEGSANGTTYTTLSDQRTTTNASAAQSYPLTGAPQARWVRVTVTGLPATNVWASFFECAVYGY